MKRILLIPTLLFAFTVFGQFPTYVPINGLAAYYPFNGNANDLSVSANHGTVSGATLTTDRFGYPNQAYYFNGNGAYIGVPHSTVHIMQQATWNIWFKLIQPNNNNLNGRYLWGKRDNASNMVVMNVYFDNPNMQIG